MQKNSKKIVIFYSSIGNGHIVAAQAIQQEILRQDASARVLLQDIRSFMSPAWRKIDERLFWFIAKHLPESFDTLFLTMQARGSSVPSLSLLPNDYPEEKVLAFLKSQAPDAILATHYGAAQVLGTLRERELLAEIRIGWLHTDFFEGYFPRISKRIDLTFLGHPELETRWRDAGVPPEKVTTSGMPVQIPERKLGTREDALRALGLATDLPTILLTGGKEGTGDYCAVVGSIARHCHRAVQIIAVCGTNERLQSQLTSLGERLPSFVVLKAFGLLSHGEMLSLMCAADLLITKAGGMTPSEAFATGTPTILLDVVSGHERINAAMFVRLGLAELASEAEKAGAMVESLLADSRRLAAMLEAQRNFRESIQVSRIAQFALDDSFVPVRLPGDFGVENGAPVTDIGKALAGISDADNANVELLLSYATSRSPQRVVMENPFGHLAIRISDVVYSANHLADQQADPNFLQHLSLADYLYGVQPSSASQVHTSTYGMAYGRETLGLRVSGISADDMAAMVAEADCMEEQFHEGSLRWVRSGFNCADVVAHIVEAGGYGVSARMDWLGLPSMPLDTFERARSAFEEAPELNLELVAYRRVPGAQAAYHFSRFPLSIGRPLRSMARVLNSASQDPLEMAVSRQVASYFGDRRLSVDNLRPNAPADDGKTTGTGAVMETRSLELALINDLRHLLGVYAKLPIKEMERLAELPAVHEMQRLVDRGQEIARIATERAVELQLFPPYRKRLRAPSNKRLVDYERLSKQKLH
jgi:UDP-N-acetylglucosamine:LPS N-acetylglucosamine transferase